MKDVRYWTDEKIQTLKIAFLQGNKLKEITKIFGKSTSAVNKALERFGIRAEKQKTPYIKWSLKDPYCQKALPSFLAPKQTKARAAKEIRKSFQEDFIWVPLFQVEKYLKKRGFQLKEIPLPLTPALFSEATFLLNQKPLTSLQLLLFANTLRLEENQPVFLVCEVTW